MAQRVPEAVIQNEIRIALGRHPRVRLFRNSVGQCWFIDGINPEKLRQLVTIAGGTLRPVKHGLLKGSSDLIGWRQIEAPDRDLTIAQFCAVEIKSATGRLTEEQDLFIQMVRNAGGVAGVVRSVEEAVRLVEC